MATRKKTTTEAVASTDPLADARRVLSTGVIVSKKGMLALSASNLQKMLTENPELPRTVLEDFTKLSSPKYVRDLILSGKDASLALKFNGLTVTPEQSEALRVLSPLLAAVEALKPVYPWVDPSEEISGITFGATGIRRANTGHKITEKQALSLWVKVARYWAGLTKAAPQGLYATFNGYSRRPEYHIDRVVIGCQTITRRELEFLARHFDWPTPEAK